MAGKLLGLSVDTLASPGLVLKPLHEAGCPPSSWGLCWYPDDDSAAIVIKDPADRRDEGVNDVIQRWDRFRSTVFLLHTRRTAKRSSQEDTQPFVRTYARRDIVLAHSGDLNGELRSVFAPETATVFEPIGRTDSELVFCWILEQMRSAGARTLADVGWPNIRLWFQQINRHGTSNVLLTDGLDVIAYRDTNGDGSLGVTRRIPPHASSTLENDDVLLNLGDHRDSHRTNVVFSTKPLCDDGWKELKPGQMVVARLGKILWDSANRQQPNGESKRLSSPLPKQVSSPDLLRAPAAKSVDVRQSEIAIPQAKSLIGDAGDDWAGIQRRILRIEHDTTYRYASPVESSLHLLRLQPVWDVEQQILDYRLEVMPEGQRSLFEDVFGNQAVRIAFNSAYAELQIKMRATIQIAMHQNNSMPHSRSTVPLVWMPWQRQLMHAYLLPPELPETQLQELSDYAMSFVERQDYDLVEALHDMNRTIYQDFQYVSGSTTLETTPFEVYSTRRGVCQDFANLFICMARLLSVPARYRVGYIYTGANYENKIQSEASHAWAEVYLPALGWRGFDPTNGCPAGTDHIRVATGRNYRDATPTSGTIFKGGGTETLDVSVRVVQVSTEAVETT